MRYFAFKPFSKKAVLPPKNVQPYDPTPHKNFDDSHIVSVSDFFARWQKGIPFNEDSVTTRFQELDDPRSVNDMLESSVEHVGDDILDFLDSHESMHTSNVITDNSINATTTTNDDDAKDKK